MYNAQSNLFEIRLMFWSIPLFEQKELQFKEYEQKLSLFVTTNTAQ